VVWNHGIFNDFPFSCGNVIIPTDEVHDFSEGWLNHQPDEKQWEFHGISPGKAIKTHGDFHREHWEFTGGRFFFDPSDFTVKNIASFLDPS